MEGHFYTAAYTMIGCHILNRMAELGRPEFYAVVS
jgi:hypothetical protein